MDRLRAFEVFTTAVLRGSFSKAADALDTSPANVTRYIGELEALVGARLLNRNSRRMSLTEAGEALYERARVILEDVADAEAAASITSSHAQGRLRINAPLSFGILQLAPLWPAFMAKYPGVELEVSLSDRVVDLVEEGFDIAIRISNSGSTAHIARKLGVSRNILCAAPSYLEIHGRPIVPADLEAHRCIAYSLALAPQDWELFDQDGASQTVRVRSAMQTNNGDTARRAAIAGAGVIWQPTFLIGDDLRRGRLERLLPAWSLPDIAILALYPSRRHLSAKVRVMVDFLAEAFSGTPSWEEGIDVEFSFPEHS